MRYKDICDGIFISRPNRFIARVRMGGTDTAVHVKNTGRCRELLMPGARVILNRSDNPNRKTAYDLIGVYKEERLFNIDSQAPNQVVKEWLELQDFDRVRPEYVYGNSRIDFYMEKGPKRYLLEVKGCTLEVGGVGYFPDAPTERGIKHIHELMRARQEGYCTALAFVIQMENVMKVLPNDRTMPEFGRAMDAAQKAGVRILYLQTEVNPDQIRITGCTEVKEI
jgi:sugar fermentation stimulation protein A